MEEHTPESQVPETPVKATQEVTEPTHTGEVIEKRKSRFVDENDLLIVELGEGDWVKIPRRFSYGFSEKFQQGTTTDDTGKIADMLVQVIREWNIVDFNGSIAIVNIENIKRLEIKDLMVIVEAATKQMKLDELPKVELPA
ncbi:hypothetical protein GW915_12260 [bacterium]|nr:hypothetical protein [bacterium]